MKRTTTPIKMALVGAFSCLTLLLSLFFTTGITSAHGTNALQSQTSANSAVDDQRCRTFVIVRERFRSYEDEATGRFFPSRNVSFFRGQPGEFVFFGNRRIFHRAFFGTFERVARVTICQGHRYERDYYQRVF